MAKEIDDDLDLDFGDDDDLDMDFDFGEPESSPPKNTREAIMNTGKQAFKGFKEDLLDDKTQTLIDMARATVPDNLKTETDAIMETSTKIKDALLESADEVRKSGKSFVKALDKVVPQNTIFSRLTKYLDEKLGEDEAKGPSGPSEEQKRHDEALAMISATLGENFEKSRADQLVQQTLEQKRHASTTDLLSNIYAESKQIRSFHVEVSNNYFRKSLELQYKHLYVAKEQLELTKTAFDSFKNQFETIVHNTGLPDLVKLRTSEMIKNSIMSKYRDAFAEKIYKNFNPMQQLGDNIVNNIKQYTEGIKAGFSTGEGLLDTFNDDSGMMTPGAMLGSQIRDLLVEKIGKRFSDKIWGTKAGKEAGYNLKGFVADPIAFMRSRAKDLEDMSKVDGIKGSMAGAGAKLLNFTSMLTNGSNTASKNIKELETPDSKAAAMFDNMTHTSINKIIPELLARIHGEVQSIRTISAHSIEDPKLRNRLTASSKQENMLVYDNKTKTFTTGKSLVESRIRQYREVANKNVYPLIKNIIDVYVNQGIHVSPGLQSKIGEAIKKAMMKNPGNSFEFLKSKEFLKYFTNKEDREKIEKINKILEEKFKGGNLDLFTSVNATVAEIRDSFPDPTEIALELEDMYGGRIIQYRHAFVKTDKKTGKSRINYDKLHGSFVSNNIRNDFNLQAREEGETENIKENILDHNREIDINKTKAAWGRALKVGQINQNAYDAAMDSLDRIYSGKGSKKDITLLKGIIEGAASKGLKIIDTDPSKKAVTVEELMYGEKISKGNDLTGANRKAATDASAKRLEILARQKADDSNYAIRKEAFDEVNKDYSSVRSILQRRLNLNEENFAKYDFVKAQLGRDVGNLGSMDKGKLISIAGELYKVTNNDETAKKFTDEELGLLKDYQVKLGNLADLHRGSVLKAVWDNLIHIAGQTPIAKAAKAAKEWYELFDKLDAWDKQVKIQQDTLGKLNNFKKPVSVYFELLNKAKATVLNIDTGKSKNPKSKPSDKYMAQLSDAIDEIKSHYAKYDKRILDMSKTDKKIGLSPTVLKAYNELMGEFSNLVILNSSEKTTVEQIRESLGKILNCLNTLYIATTAAKGNVAGEQHFQKYVNVLKDKQVKINKFSESVINTVKDTTGKLEIVNDVSSFVNTNADKVKGLFKKLDQTDLNTAAKEVLQDTRERLRKSKSKTAQTALKIIDTALYTIQEGKKAFESEEECISFICASIRQGILYGTDTVNAMVALDLPGIETRLNALYSNTKENLEAAAEAHKNRNK